MGFLDEMVERKFREQSVTSFTNGRNDGSEELARRLVEHFSSIEDGISSIDCVAIVKAMDLSVRWKRKFLDALNELETATR